jgi:hypothetical protein
LVLHQTDKVWTVDFETPLCKLYLLFISANAAQEKEKREVSAAAQWCFKVYSPYRYFKLTTFLVSKTNPC